MGVEREYLSQWNLNFIHMKTTAYFISYNKNDIQRERHENLIHCHRNWTRWWSCQWQERYGIIRAHTFHNIIIIVVVICTLLLQIIIKGTRMRERYWGQSTYYHSNFFPIHPLNKLWIVCTLSLHYDDDVMIYACEWHWSEVLT